MEEVEIKDDFTRIMSNQGSKLSYQLFIPTRNGAKWLGVFLDAYRELGVEPLYIVDGRTSDDTVSLLKEKKANFLIFTPKADFPEAGMLEYAAQNIESDWLLRMDDDEFPSRHMLKWLKEYKSKNDNEVWRISRRDISNVNGDFVYSNWPTRKQFSKYGFVLNPQQRFFNKNKVKFIEEVHSPGFVSDTEAVIAAPEVFFIHCNNILRSPSERLNKIKSYAQYRENMSWRVIDESLPEITPLELHDFSSSDLKEFEGLFLKLPLAEENKTLDILPDELQKAQAETYKWVAESLVFYQNSFVDCVSLIKDLKRANRYGIAFLPRRIIILLAELSNTTSRFFNSKKLARLSSFMWRIKRIKEL